MALLTVQIEALADQLLACKTAESDQNVQVEAGEHGRLTVGRIMLVARASGRSAWFWTVTGPVGAGSGVGLVGEADDLEAAKTEFRRAFDALLYWAAMSRDGEIAWQVGAEWVGG